ncbi:MAG TPA: hypothetical protein VGO80_22195 [Solirubrobacteraceae bacterium]|nr:hypothetical protein [Solirubrobacteraceae bacterium]
MSEIVELRILPPLAIGRLGASDRPVDNYDAVVEPGSPLGYRRLVPAQTLEVDVPSGKITRAFVPDELTFSEDGMVRPVAPFLELWALTSDGRLEPVTTALLERSELRPSDVCWRAHVANHKIFRRTGKADDRIEADTGDFSDHGAQPLKGACANFVDGAHLPLGHVQYIDPNDEFPEVRLRFTPAAGYVYGSTTGEPDELIHAVLYDSARGSWRGYKENASTIDPKLTIPGQIYAGKQKGVFWVSKGYLDDECDGLVYASLEVGGKRLSAYARIGAGPPAYAPDSFPVRTVHDELEQALLGPDAEPDAVSIERAEEIVRRAFETIRLMNTEVMNGNTIDGRVDVASTMVRQDTNDTGRAFEPIMATSLVDMKAVEALHLSLLVALRSATAPWFSDVLRRHDEIGDLSDKGRRKMPALMRNADGRGLALTRRQVDIVRKLAAGPISPNAQP